MREGRRSTPKTKNAPQLHPRNKNIGDYDFEKLCKVVPQLESFLMTVKSGRVSIDFSNPFAVKYLNQALMKQSYGVGFWEVPKGFLVPPVPGRADYIHYIADLLGSFNNDVVPTGDTIKCFDVGVGANCIYPLIGHSEYGWSFVGAEVDEQSLKSAREIVNKNEGLRDVIDCRFQKSSKDFFFGVVRKGERFDISICNPPFHSSVKEAYKSNIRKNKNLSGKWSEEPKQNFAGRDIELCYEGGESTFLWRMIHQSKKFSNHFFWFSSLVSKESNLKNVYTTLKKVGATLVETIPMQQGNKTSRLVAWTFLSRAEQEMWVETRWQN